MKGEIQKDRAGTKSITNTPWTEIELNCKAVSRAEATDLPGHNPIQSGGGREPGSHGAKWTNSAPRKRGH